MLRAMQDPRGHPRYRLGEPVSLEELQRVNDTAQELDRPTGPRLSYGRAGGLNAIPGEEEWQWFRVTAKPDSPGTPAFFYSGIEQQQNDDGTEWVDKPGGVVCAFDGIPLIESNHREDVPAGAADDDPPGAVVKAKIGDNGQSWVFTYQHSAPAVIPGDGPPVDPPPDVTVVNLYFDQSQNVMWVWDVVSQTWVVISPVWAPTYVNTTGLYTLQDGDVKLAFGSPGTIDGVVGGVAGKLLVIWNRSSGQLVLKHSTTTPSGILCPLGVDYVLWPRDGVIIEYDAVSQLWRFDVPTLGTGAGAHPDPPAVYATRHIRFGGGLSYTDNLDGSVDVAVDDDCGSHYEGVFCVLDCESPASFDPETCELTLNLLTVTVECGRIKSVE